MPADKHPPQLILNLIMGAILVWGSLLALGVLLFRKSWLGAGIALTCTLVFLGGWKLLLLRRGGKRRAGQGGDASSE